MRINISRLDTFGLCPQKYAWQYEPQERAPFGLVPARETTPELDFGLAIHAGLAAHYAEASEKGMLDAYRASIAVQTGAEEEHHQSAYGERMLLRYVEHYKDADKDWEVLAVEQEFEYELGGHTFVGRWDMLVRSRLLGTIEHIQHKTTGATDLTKYVRQYDLAWHERLYVPAAQERFPKERIGGTILNLLKKKASQKVESGKDFLRYYVPTADVERFQRDALARVKRIEEARESGVFEQNPVACSFFGRLCAYHGGCLGLGLDEQDFTAREPDYVDVVADKGDKVDITVEKESAPKCR